MKLKTNTVHAGVDKDKAYNSIITPIYQTSTFKFEDIGTTKGFDYTRSGNPTRTALEENIASLENGTLARVTNTGMSAITTVMHFLKSGDHIICTNDCYGGTERLLRLYKELFNIEVSYVNMDSQNEVKDSFRKNTKIVWVETPSNPLLNIYDIEKLSQLAHENNSLVVVDNTFLSPVNQRPLDLGADIVIHSTTKYLNGHSDVVGGAIVVKNAALSERLSYLVNALGQGEAPFDSWLVLRGIKTLVPRMKAHEQNANEIATFLSSHKKVKKVNYPGLQNHPQHELAKKQQFGFGGMMSFEVNGNINEVNHVLKSTKIFSLAESLGGIESLICHPATMTHASMDAELKKKVGINDNLIRLSIGIEDVDDLIADLEYALNF